MTQEEQIRENQANRSLHEIARSDRDKIRKLRKSPEVRGMYCLRVGTAEFYFITEARMKSFWEGDGHIKGYRQKLIDENGQAAFDAIHVETYKK